MKTEEMKTTASTMKELNESYMDLLQAMKGTIREAKRTRQLWRNGSKSRLIKLGLTLIVFPEPTPISETAGAFLIAAGAVQKGIRSRVTYIEDVYKASRRVLGEVSTVRNDI